MPIHTAPTDLPELPWREGLFSPLSWAAYITVFAIAASVIDWAALSAGNRREWAGLGSIGLFLACFILRGLLDSRRPNSHRVAGGLVLLQAALTLAASWLLVSGTAAVLLIIVAAQLVGLYSLRIAVLLLAAVNLALAAIWLQHWTLRELLLAFLPIVGFQAFAGLTARYAMESERARLELGQVNAELLATRQLLDESARSEERLKLSRELHDVSGHKLTALRLNLARLLRDEQLLQREEIAAANDLAAELLDDIRAVVGELRRHDGIDLRESLQALARQIPDGRVTLTMDSSVRAGNLAQAQTLLRCAQEAITNALKHGHATQIEVSCSRRGDRLELAVRDNGNLKPELVFGHGLQGMRERLEALSGELHVAPRAGRGVELVASLPAAY